MKQEDIATTAAETFWKIAELRCELFKWQDSSERIGIAQLAKMMLLEKKSLPDVAEALYREATTVDLVRYLEERGCASERISIYTKAVVRVDEELVAGWSYLHYNKDIFSSLPNLRLATFHRFPGGAERSCQIYIRPGGDIYRGVNLSCYQPEPPLHREIDNHTPQNIFLDVDPKVTHLKILRSSRTWFAAPVGPHLTSGDLASGFELYVAKADYTVTSADAVTTPYSFARFYEFLHTVGMRQRVARVEFNALFPPKDMRYFRQCQKLVSIEMAEDDGYHQSSLLEYLKDLAIDASLPSLRHLSFSHRPCCQDLTLPSQTDLENFAQLLRDKIPNLGTIDFHMWCDYGLDKRSIYGQYATYVGAHLGDGWIAELREDELEGNDSGPGSEEAEDIEEEIPELRFMRVKLGELGGAAGRVGTVERRPGWRVLGAGPVWGW